MTDIVERLRNRAVDFAVQEGGFTDEGDLIVDAADEIERLRAALKAIASWSDEEDEWDGRDKFHAIRDMAWATLTTPEGK